MKKIIVVLVLLVFSNANSNNSNSLLPLKNSIAEISDTTYKCTIFTFSKNIYKDANLSGLSDSTVRILRGESSTEIHINDIKSIKFKGRGFLSGAAVGGGIGFLLGAIAGAVGSSLGSDGSYDGSLGGAIGVGALFAVPFALIGGGIGVLLSEDKFYDLSKLDFEAKRKRIKNLIIKYSDR